MAAGRLPEPGSEYGPCITCEHIDCQETRERARGLCRFCDGVIGYGNRYYSETSLTDGVRELVHANCLEDSLEI